MLTSQTFPEEDPIATELLTSRWVPFVSTRQSAIRPPRAPRAEPPWRRCPTSAGLGARNLEGSRRGSNSGLWRPRVTGVDSVRMASRRLPQMPATVVYNPGELEECGTQNRTGDCDVAACDHFPFYGDPSTGHFNSTVTSIEFTSQQRCDDGRKAFLTELTPIRDKLNQAITDGLEVGQLKGSNGIVISALCVQK